jgi:hypothetical protein
LRKPRSARHATTLVVVLALALAGSAGSATAAMTGLQRVAPATALNSSPKGITATCPEGTQVVGAGGDTTPGNGQVLIGAIRPSIDMKRVIVNAHEDRTGTVDSWYVQAFAICAPAPPGLQRVARTSPSNSVNKQVTATCPSGKRVLGTGGEITSPNGQVLLEDITPNAGLTAVTVRGVEERLGNAKNWSVTAFAVCAQPVAGLERVSRETAKDPSAPKVGSAPCPAGKQVTGVAGEITSPVGTIVLDAVYPNADLTGAGMAAFEDESGNSVDWSLKTYAICVGTAERVALPVSLAQGSGGTSVDCSAGRQVTSLGAELAGARGQASIWYLGIASGGPWAGARADRDGTTAAWSATAYGICALPVPGREVVKADSDFDSSNKTVTVDCPAGKRVIGTGGGTVTGLDGGPQGAQMHQVLGEITPNPALTSVTVRAFETDGGFDQNWYLDAYAFCATPPAGLQLVSATTPQGSEESERVTATCPAGKTLVGMGAALPSDVFARGDVMLDDIRPDPALRRVTVNAFEDQDGTTGVWKVTAHAICANP